MMGLFGNHPPEKEDNPSPTRVSASILRLERLTDRLEATTIALEDLLASIKRDGVDHHD